MDDRDEEKEDKHCMAGGRLEEMNGGERKKQKNREMWILAILFMLSVVMVSYYIFSFSKGRVNSDTAAKVLFANQQHVKHQYFPENFCYSTGVFVFGIENIISFLMLFMKDWVLCGEVAQFIQVLLFFAALYFFFSVIFKKIEGYIGCSIGVLLFALPLSATFYNLYYYQAAYTKYAVNFLLIFAVTGKIISENMQKGKWIWFFLLALITILNNLGIRNVMLVEVLGTLSKMGWFQ